MKENERELVTRITAALDAETSGLDQQTLERLGAMRRNAVELVERKTSRSWHRRGFPQWVSASGFATMAVVVIAVSIWLAAPRHREGRQIEDVEILTSREQFDVYEDLEFYRWLATTRDEH
jgi:hypothetical protein